MNIPLRRSTRNNKGIPPMKLSLMVQNELKKEPSSWNEMILLPEEEQKQWIRAAAEEMSSHNKNQTWILCDLPAEKKVIDANGCSTPMHADYLYITAEEKLLHSNEQYRQAVVALLYTSKPLTRDRYQDNSSTDISSTTLRLQT